MPGPAPTGLYHVYGEADSLLYIGVSKHFGVRWQQHAQKQPWWNERRRMTVDFYDDREEALDAEALAIFTEQPKYNVLHRKQALRLKKLQSAPVSTPRRSGQRSAKKAKPTPPGRRWEDPRYLAYLRSEKYEQDVKRDFEHAREKEQRRLTGTWSDCERQEWVHGRAINAAIDRDIDLDSPEFYALWAQMRSADAGLDTPASPSFR